MVNKNDVQKVDQQSEKEALKEEKKEKENGWIIYQSIGQQKTTVSYVAR